MSNFDGLIFFTQLQQNSRLADLRDGVDHVHAQLTQLQRHQAQAAKAQERLNHLREEIFNYANYIQSTSHDLDQTAGLACFWCFRFLYWASQEGVSTSSFSEYEDKHIFDQALKRTHEVLNHCARRYYTPEEMCRIERFVFMERGMFIRHKAYAGWSRIKAIASKHRFLFSTLDTLTVWINSLFILFSAPAVVWYFWSRFNAFDLFFLGVGGFFVGSIAGLILPHFLFFIPHQIKARIVKDKLNPLATETGGTVANDVNLGVIEQIILNLKVELQNTWGNNLILHDTLEDIDDYHQSLCDEYTQTKSFLESPPSKIPPHIRDLEPLIPERKAS